MLAVLALLSACSGKKENPLPQEMEMHKQLGVEVYIDTMVPHQTAFNKQIVCNGKLVAKAKSDLNFTQQGLVEDVKVREGQRVQKGSLIATLDKKDRQRELEKAEHELERQGGTDRQADRPGI